MRTSTLTSLVLLGQVYGGFLGDVAVVGRDDSTDAKMRRYIDSIIEPPEKRQEGTSTVNTTQWNESVLSACSSTLQSLKGVAGNPSGVAACYNIPFWDNSTGIFHADLRLYTISQATGSFAGIAPQDVKIDLSYTSASVQSVDNAALRRRQYDSSLLLAVSEFDKRQSGPALSQSYAFYGRLNQGSAGSDLYVYFPSSPSSPRKRSNTPPPEPPSSKPSCRPSRSAGPMRRARPPAPLSR